jgi:hypothetical protein
VFYPDPAASALNPSIAVQLLLNTLLILTGWIIAAVVLAGVGLALRRAAGPRKIVADDLLRSFWVGFAAVVLFLQLWHFWLPVDGLAASLLVAVGVAGLLINYRSILVCVQALSWTRDWWFLAIITTVLLWAASLAAGPPSLADTGIYHAQSVRWSTEYAVVPGLGNLFGRFAFNSSGLLYAALFELGPLAGRGTHFANGSLLAVLLVQGIWGGRRFVQAGNAIERSVYLYDFLLLAPLLDCVMRDHLRSFSTDLHVGAVMLVSSSRLTRLVLYATADQRQRAFEFVTTAGLVALAVCMKLTAAAFTLAGLAVLFWIWLRERQDPRAPRVGALSVACCAALLLPWAGRGIVSSGYPAYPIPIAPVQVPWRVPQEQARAELAWVVHHARYESRTKLGSGSDWLGPWLRRALERPYHWTHFLLPLVLLAIIPPLWRWRARRRDPPLPSGVLLAAIPPLLGLLAWFSSAPAVRFGWAPLWLLAALFPALILGSVDRLTAFGRRVCVVSGIAMALVPVTLPSLAAWVRLGAHAGFRDFIERTLPNSDSAVPGLSRLPRPAGRPYVTQSGLRLSMGLANGYCWDARLPCSPSPSPNLVLRGTGLKDGFEIKGSWQPVAFPNAESRFLDFWRCKEALAKDAARARQCLIRVEGIGPSLQGDTDEPAPPR